jgi:hypothetical protein
MAVLPSILPPLTPDCPSGALPALHTPRVPCAPRPMRPASHAPRVPCAPRPMRPVNPPRARPQSVLTLKAYMKRFPLLKDGAAAPRLLHAPPVAPPAALPPSALLPLVLLPSADFAPAAAPAQLPAPVPPGLAPMPDPPPAALLGALPTPPFVLPGKGSLQPVWRQCPAAATYHWLLSHAGPIVGQRAAPRAAAAAARPEGVAAALGFPAGRLPANILLFAIPLGHAGPAIALQHPGIAAGGGAGIAGFVTPIHLAGGAATSQPAPPGVMPAFAAGAPGAALAAHGTHMLPPYAVASGGAGAGGAAAHACDGAPSAGSRLRGGAAKAAAAPEGMGETDPAGIGAEPAPPVNRALRPAAAHRPRHNRGAAPGGAAAAAAPAQEAASALLDV